jgi:hypothetical protein
MDNSQFKPYNEPFKSFPGADFCPINGFLIQRLVLKIKNED